MLGRNGSVIAEGWWWPNKPSRPHVCHSLTKSITGTAVGIAISEGLFNKTDKVVSFFPDFVPEDASENLKAMTVEDLLTMRTGHAVETSGKIWRPIKTSWITEFFKIPVVYKPGTHPKYTSAASYMLSAIITRATSTNGKNTSMAEFLRPRLFEPLGILNWTWDLHAIDNVSPGGNGLTMTTDGSLKLGMLHAQKGMWKGVQLLPREYVEKATRPSGTVFNYKYGNGSSSSYGYQWWMGGSGKAFFGDGVYTQVSIVFPDHDATLAVFASIRDTGEYTGADLMPYVFKSFPEAFSNGPLSPDPEAAMALKQRTGSLRLVPDLKPTTSPCVNSISGRRFQVVTNSADPWQDPSWVQFDFVDANLEYQMADSRGTHKIIAGLGSWYESSTDMTGAPLHYEYESDWGTPYSVVVAGAQWVDDFTLVMTWQFAETAWRDVVKCHFDTRGDRPKVKISRRVNTQQSESHPVAMITFDGIAE
jgi:CubicO group peptidase (beta-lactamase class C family)